MANSSRIGRPKGLSSHSEMSYSSLALLYDSSRQDIFGDQMAFAVACESLEKARNGVEGCILKLEVTASPSFSDAIMDITHEVLPGKGACSRIIDIHDRLKVATFDNGTIIPIKNFGFKKTFNCDVRAGLTKHTAPICSVVRIPTHDRIATGSTNGEISLYEFQNENITFISRTKVSTSPVTSMVFIKPSRDDAREHSDEGGLYSFSNHVLYSTLEGNLGLLDPQCEMGDSISLRILKAPEPRFNISALCMAESVGPGIVFVGGVQGHLATIDLRNPSEWCDNYVFPEDKNIRTIKEVTVSKGCLRRSFLAYTNGTPEIRILDLKTMKPDSGWSCDRLPEHCQMDICQVDDRIITCGLNSSIGCWTWTEIRAQEISEQASNLTEQSQVDVESSRNHTTRTE